MTVQVEAREIAYLDWVQPSGTVRKVTEHKDKEGNVVTLDFEFWNGETQSGVSPDALFDVIQGGILDRVPSQSVRSGLAADHAKE
jgi:hypothetical protein